MVSCQLDRREAYVPYWAEVVRPKRAIMLDYAIRLALELLVSVVHLDRLWRIGLKKLLGIYCRGQCIHFRQLRVARQS